MAIVNRDVDSSGQRDYITWTAGLPVQGATFTIANTAGLVVTGTTINLFGPMPYPYTLQSVNAITNGASGAPLLTPLIARPASGGLTIIAVSISAMVVANAASMNSSSLTYSGLAPQGSTLLIGQRGDFLMCTTGGANTACTALMVQVVVRKTQDIVSMNNV